MCDPLSGDPKGSAPAARNATQRNDPVVHEFGGFLSNIKKRYNQL